MPTGGDHSDLRPPLPLRRSTPARAMNEYVCPLRPVSDSTRKPAPHWRVKEIATEHGFHYEVVGSDGVTVASDIQSLELARLFALSPQIFSHFKSLRVEAERSLLHMVDRDTTQCDIEEVAEDTLGDWERVSPGAPAFAQWLLALEQLEEMVGPQTYPPKGVSVQRELFAD